VKERRERSQRELKDEDGRKGEMRREVRLTSIISTSSIVVSSSTPGVVCIVGVSAVGRGVGGAVVVVVVMMAGVGGRARGGRGRIIFLRKGSQHCVLFEGEEVEDGW